jgi:hypothetical protein
MTDKHTPGPWVGSANVHGLVHQRNKPYNIVVDLQWPQLMTATEIDANARLIAAAPELLEELEYIVEMLANGAMPSGSDITNGRAAIKAAKGDA